MGVCIIRQGSITILSAWIYKISSGQCARARGDLMRDLYNMHVISLCCYIEEHAVWGGVVLCNNSLGRCQKYWQAIGGFDIFIVRHMADNGWVILCVGEGFDIICASGGEEIKVLWRVIYFNETGGINYEREELGGCLFYFWVICLSMHTNFFLSLSLDYILIIYQQRASYTRW